MGFLVLEPHNNRVEDNYLIPGHRYSHRQGFEGRSLELQGHSAAPVHQYIEPAEEREDLGLRTASEGGCGEVRRGLWERGVAQTEKKALFCYFSLFPPF